MSALDDPRPDDSRPDDAEAREEPLRDDERGDGGRGDADPADFDSTLRFEALPDSPTCPFCGGTDTEQFSAFGSQASTSQYYCRPCRSVFEFMKWRAR